MWVAAARAMRLMSDDLQERPETLQDWINLANALGLEVVWARLPVNSHACVLADVIVLQPGLTEEEEIAALRHEISHELLHYGNTKWWESQPLGEQMIAKRERQARELSEMLTWELEEIRQAYLDSSGDEE